jgi:hypothetical protein
LKSWLKWTTNQAGLVEMGLQVTSGAIPRMIAILDGGADAQQGRPPDVLTDRPSIRPLAHRPCESINVLKPLYPMP